MDGAFEFITRFDVANACLELEDTFRVMHDLAKTPLEASYDVYMHKESASLDCNDILLIPHDRSHISPMCSHPSSSLEYYFNVPYDLCF